MTIQFNKPILMILCFVFALACGGGGGGGDDLNCGPDSYEEAGTCVLRPQTGPIENLGDDLHFQRGIANEDGLVRFVDGNAQLDLVLGIADAQNPDNLIRGAVSEVVYGNNDYMALVTDPSNEMFPSMTTGDGFLRGKRSIQAPIQIPSQAAIQARETALMHRSWPPAKEAVENSLAEVLMRHFFQGENGFVGDYCLSAEQFYEVLTANAQVGVWLHVGLGEEGLSILYGYPFKKDHLPELDDIVLVLGDRFHLVLRGPNLPDPTGRPLLDPAALRGVMALFVTYVDPEDLCQPTFEDIDQDGVADADDNCPEVPNADQSDSDANGVGDACDPNDNPLCGDGVVDTQEVCDGGSVLCEDGCYEGSEPCLKDCQGYGSCDLGNQACGNGSIEGCEFCDDGDEDDCDQCASDCSGPGAVPVCGDGKMECGEVCEIGAALAAPFDMGCGQVAPTCNNCAICVADGDVCGDGVIGTSEVCDDGDTDNCTPTCNATCSGVYAVVCGDGKIECGEVCEAGTGLAAPFDRGCNEATPHCSQCSVCASADVCGDGVVGPTEACDDGDTNDCTTGCDASCAGPHEIVCGDGKAECGEVCDDGDVQFCGGSCNESCTAFYPQTDCGNLIIDCGEACDDGPGGGCLDDCSGINICGDGVVFGNESCDEGGDTANCDGDCTLPACGDGYSNPNHPLIVTGMPGTEVCDDGPGGDCFDDCTGLNVCGDWIVFGNEVCDAGGDTANCDGDCTLPACGDGYFNPKAGATAPEACDDGDNDDCTTACNANCTGPTPAPVCGNWITECGETCDNGPDNGISGYCNATCSGMTP